MWPTCHPRALPVFSRRERSVFLSFHLSLSFPYPPDEGGLEELLLSMLSLLLSSLFSFVKTSSFSFSSVTSALNSLMIDKSSFFVRNGDPFCEETDDISALVSELFMTELYMISRENPTFIDFPKGRNGVINLMILMIQ